MELEFKKEELRWLEPVVEQVHNLEQTQEIKLSDGMPDIGRVLSAWGQPVLRGKEWRGDGFSASGGMMIWVLYAPEDGSQPRSVSGWLPCQMQWDLPAGTPDGQIRVLCLPRFVDARSVSPRKILVRAGISALGEAYIPARGSTYTPGQLPEDVQLLQHTYPVRLWMEAGEKTFQMDEELTLPASCPAARKLICGTLHPEVTEHRLMNGRILFRGSANLRVLYVNEEGQPFSWEFPLSFSHYDELTGSISSEGQGEFFVMPTDMDLSLDEEGHFRIKCGFVAQYILSDLAMIHTVEDAYSPQRELELNRTELEVPAILETARHSVNAEQHISQEGNLAVEGVFYPDFPRQRRKEDAVELEIPGNFQMLYYSPEGALQSASARWEGKLSVEAHPDTRLLAVPGAVSQTQTDITGEGMILRAQLGLSVQTMVRQSVPMISGIVPGEPRKPEEDRPSLILRRAGEDTLWQIARESGSTVEAIRAASNLEGEPAPDCMLLIPVL